MTEATHRALAALAVVVACAAGGLLAVVLSQRLSPTPPDAVQVIDRIDRILQSEGPDVLVVVDSVLPADASALVLRRPELDAAPLSSDPRSQPDGATGPSAEQQSGEPSTEPKRNPPGAQEPERPSASPGGAAVTPAPPAAPVRSGRTLLVVDPAVFAVEYGRLQETSIVAERVLSDRTRLAVAMPPTGRSNWTAAAVVAGVVALTGVLAATFAVLLWPVKTGHTDEPPADPTHSAGRRLPLPVPVGVGAPPGTGSVPPVPSGIGQAAPGPPGVVAAPPPAPPDPQLPVSRTQRATLIRGLADLAAKLPAEYEWQAANVLDAAGVRQIVPDGEAFDPASHHAVDTEPTPDAQLDDTVARTLRPGWADGSQVVVPARVVVYALAAQRSSGPDDVAR